MRLAVTSWSFPLLTLDEVGGLTKVLGFEGLDLGYFYRSALNRTKLLATPEIYGDEVKTRLPVPVSNLYHLFGNSVADRNLSDPAARATNTADFGAVLKFCASVGSPTVFILPGVINGAQSRAQALAETVESLKPLLDMAARTEVTVCVEPHIHSYLESPSITAELCERATGVKLALDYAHFAVSGYRQEEIDELVRWAGHVHLRQSRPGALQVKLDEGTLNFPAMFATLRDAGFKGWLASEIVHQGYFDTLHDDVLTETVKLRDLFRTWSA